jgi:GR25 family glycosyltransferase involved in LPS biosynthesis
MKAFILGVRGRYRGEVLESQLRELGWNYEVIYGIDGSKLDAEGVSTLTNQADALARYGRTISPGEACCTLGHLNIAKSFLDSGENWGLVLEDDALLEPDFKERMNRLSVDLKNLNTKSIIQLHGLDFVTKLFSRGNPSSSLIPLVSGGYSTKAYILGRLAANMIVQKSNSRSTSALADWPSNWRWNIQFYKTNDSFVKENEIESLLEFNRAQLPNKSENLTGIPALFQSMSRTTKMIRRTSQFEDSFRGIFLVDLEMFLTRQTHRLVKFMSKHK